MFIWTAIYFSNPTDWVNIPTFLIISNSMAIFNLSIDNCAIFDIFLLVIGGVEFRKSNPEIRNTVIRSDEARRLT